jgi:hypothetical protein
MDSLIRIKDRLKESLVTMDEMRARIDFNRDHEGSLLLVKEIISTLNKCQPLAGYIDARFQEDLLLNLREFEHRFYIKVDAWPYFDTCVSIIERLVNKVETQVEFGELIPAQKYYFKNKKFSVLSDLDSIFRNATTELTYYDPYMDHVLVEAVSDLDVPVINLILTSASEKFKLFVAELNKERGLNVNYFEFQDKDIHDRYCLIDGSELWQISGTVNAKNINSVTLTKISDEEAQTGIIADLNKILNS